MNKQLGTTYVYLTRKDMDILKNGEPIEIKLTEYMANSKSIIIRFYKEKEKENG